VTEHVLNSVVTPSDAPVLVRQSLGVAADAPLRIAYVAGPGDACGTFDYWARGLHDPRTPVVAYSSMFYSVVASIDATALILIEQDKQPSSRDPRFQFVYTPHRRGRRGLGYRIDEFAFSTSVLPHLRDFRPDVIIVGTDAPNRLVRNLPPARRIILTAHNSFWPMGHRPDNLRARLRLWSTKRALQRIDLAVNTSSECAFQVAALGGPSGMRSFTEIPQVLETFYPMAVEPRPVAQSLLYLGRIEANKGVFDLLGAFTGLAKDHPELHLGFAGTGSADAALKEAVATSGCADRISIHGLLPAIDVHRLLDKTDLLVCPTRTASGEGLALVVVEAAVHGVPTLLSSIVPAKMLFPEGCLEFPVDDMGALAETMRTVVENSESYCRLRTAVSTQRSQFINRAESWGSQLYRALALRL
jgi:glycogen synthase